MKTAILALISVLTVSMSASAYKLNKYSDLMVLEGLIGHIDVIKECVLDMDKFKIVGSQITTQVVCWAGKGTSFDNDLFFDVKGFVKGQGENAVFIPTEVKQVFYE